MCMDQKLMLQWDWIKAQCLKISGSSISVKFRLASGLVKIAFSILKTTPQTTV